MTIRASRLVPAALLLPLAVATHSRWAAACLNGVILHTDTQVERLSSAERSLGTGKARSAAEVALSEFPTLHDTPKLMQARGSTGLDLRAVRAQRLAAVALVRTDGLLTAARTFGAGTAAERRTNLEWAIGILRAIVALKSLPADKTDLAEALSKLPETREEALTLLNDLDKRDLVTSRQGYAVLAELRAAANDVPGRDAALKRLNAMTKAGVRPVG